MALASKRAKSALWKTSCVGTAELTRLEEISFKVIAKSCGVGWTAGKSKNAILAVMFDKLYWHTCVCKLNSTSNPSSPLRIPAEKN